MFLYLLFNASWKETNFVYAWSRIPVETMRKLKKYAKRSMLGFYFQKIDHKINSPTQYFMRVVRKLVYVIFRIRLYWFKKIYGNNIIAYGQDHAYASAFFFPFRFVCVEDGLGNYQEKSVVERGSQNFMFPFCQPFIPNGWSDHVDCIYLSGRLDIPPGLRSKAKIFDIKAQWEKKDEKEKLEIMDIFGFNYDSIHKIVSSGRNVFLLTQNYAPDYCSERELVDFYAKLLVKYDLSSIIIKPHPGDHIIYEKYFPECFILREDYPFEFLYLTNIPIKKIISINSTATYGCWADDIVELHEEFFKKYPNFFTSK